MIARTFLCSALFATIALLAACGRQADTPAPAAAATPAPDTVVLDAAAQTRAGISVADVAQVTRAELVSAPGLIVLDEMRTARVGSLQEGLVLNTQTQVGDRVRVGQLLATMHGHAVHDAWAGYRKAVADRRRRQTELAYATDALGRAQRLYNDKAISLQERQRAEVDQVSAREQLDMAEAEVRRSIEELEHIGISIDDTGSSGATILETGEQIPVKSPIRGVVLERLVTPGTTVVPGSPMFVVSDLSTLWAVAELDESHLSRVRAGRSVSVRVAAYPDSVFPGTITFIGDVVNPKTRRITVRATVPNPDGRLKPEMFAMIELGESEPRAAVVVPSAAIQSVDGGPVVFVSEGNGTFRVRHVEVGAEANGGIETVSGLKPGERIAASGSFVLKSELMKASADRSN